jgi:hypothetical protein
MWVDGPMAVLQIMGHRTYKRKQIICHMTDPSSHMRQIYPEISRFFVVYPLHFAIETWSVDH